jgi:hypothetical protein
VQGTVGSNSAGNGRGFVSANFTVNGQKYSTSNYVAARTPAKFLEVGDSIEVLFDPNNPKQACLPLLFAKDGGEQAEAQANKRTARQLAEYVAMAQPDVAVPGELRFEGELTFGQQLRATVFTNMPGLRSLLLRLGFAIGVAALLIYANETRTTTTRDAVKIARAAGGALFALGIGVYPYFAAFAQTLRERREARTKRDVYVAGVPGIGVVSHGQRFIDPWDSIVRKSVTADLVTLVSNRGNYLAIAKGFASSPGDWEQLLGYVRERVRTAK